jgi:hypothetical protein
LWIIDPRGGSRISGHRECIEKVSRKFWGILCEKSRFYAKNHIFSNFRGGGVPGAHPFHLITDKGNNSYEIIKLE